MITLLTGVPGIGKTTVATTLANKHPGRIQALSFGQLIFDCVRSRTSRSFTYSYFRSNAASLVTPTDIDMATDLVVEKARSVDENSWLVLDSHAVSREKYGFRSTPDSPDKLRSLGYACIVHLRCPGADEVLRRAVEANSGRGYRTAEDIQLIDAFQIAVCTYYAGILGCPLHILDAVEPAEVIADEVSAILFA